MQQQQNYWKQYWENLDNSQTQGAASLNLSQGSCQPSCQPCYDPCPHSCSRPHLCQDEHASQQIIKGMTNNLALFMAVSFFGFLGFMFLYTRKN